LRNELPQKRAYLPSITARRSAALAPYRYSDPPRIKEVKSSSGFGNIFPPSEHAIFHFICHLGWNIYLKWSLPAHIQMSLPG